MYRLSTNTGPLYSRFSSIYEILDAIKEVGFEAYDFSMFNCNKSYGYSLLDDDSYINKAKELRKHSDKINLPCNQAHAPFITYDVTNPNNNELIHKKLYRAIEIASILGANYIIIHPCNTFSSEQNAELLKPFGEFAKKHNIKIAIENMFNWNGSSGKASRAACSTMIDFNKHLDLLDNEVFAACLDVGHASIMGEDCSPFSMIISLKDRLSALHLHSNDLRHDSHELPLTMDVDFNAIIKGLKIINYKGDFTLECDNYIINRQNYDIKRLLKNMFNVIDKIRCKFLK